MCRLSSAPPSGPTTKQPQLATFAVLQAHGTQASSSKHMAQASTKLQAHGMPHVSRVVKHVVLIVQNIGKLGGHGQAQAMRPNLQNVCAGQNFRPLTCI